jgi:hypothetical protein
MSWPEAIASIIGALVLGEMFGGVVSDVVSAFKKKYECPCECHNLEDEDAGDKD